MFTKTKQNNDSKFTDKLCLQNKAETTGNTKRTKLEKQNAPRLHIIYFLLCDFLYNIYSSFKCIL